MLQRKDPGVEMRYLNLLFILILCACSAPKASPPPPLPTEDAVGTQVSVILTRQPSPTIQPATATLGPTSTEIPTVTPPPATETPTATTSPTIEPTLPSGDPKVYLGQPEWFTSLETGRNFGVVENDNTRIYQENGALVLTGVFANGWRGWSLTFSRQPQDFYLDATFKTQSCSGSDQYGLMFRAPNTSAGYFYGITCNGQYFFEANDFNDNGFQSGLVDLTPSQYILAGSNQINRLGVMAKADQLSLYINGSLIQEISDTNFKEKGYFGAFISAYETANLIIQMDEISLWNLP